MQELKIWIQIIDNKAGLEFHEDIWYKDLVGSVLPVGIFSGEEYADEPIEARWQVLGDERKLVFVEDTQVLSMMLGGRNLFRGR